MFEDPGTITAHDAVRPRTKYNITAYLRLYSQTIDVLKNIYIHIHYYLSIFMYILFTPIYPSFKNYFVASMNYKLNRNIVTTNGASINAKWSNVLSAFSLFVTLLYNSILKANLGPMSHIFGSYY